MPDYTLENIAVGITEQTLVVSEVDKTEGKGFFLINKGTGVVTFRFYGSPTGLRRANYQSKNGNSVYTQAEEDLHYILVATQAVAVNGNAFVDLSAYIYDFFKLTAQSTIADTTINYRLQQAYTNQ